VFPDYGSNFLDHEREQNAAPDAENDIVQLEKELQFQGLLRLHDLPQTEDDCKVGNQRSRNGREG
jgi:hypothetical protein